MVYSDFTTLYLLVNNVEVCFNHIITSYRWIYIGSHNCCVVSLNIEFSKRCFSNVMSENYIS